MTAWHDFIDFLLTEHLLAYFLLAGKIIDSKKVWFKYTPKIHTKNGWLKWLVHQKNPSGVAFIEFHRLKINIEDPFTQAKFSGMFLIKTHHLCRKQFKKSLEPVFWSHFLPLSDVSIFPMLWQSQFMKSIKKIIFELRKDQSQDLGYYIFDF